MIQWYWKNDSENNRIHWVKDHFVWQNDVIKIHNNAMNISSPKDEIQIQK